MNLLQWWNRYWFKLFVLAGILYWSWFLIIALTSTKLHGIERWMYAGMAALTVALLVGWMLSKSEFGGRGPDS